ncbi:hypothetical protein WG922_09950 [Ramlibacter sp. AN1015]|uniref:hypothetical protein n=1 Tax=Ramlibacter sp. AN1015 TaxID=3133428 RepID=UPI0030BF7586
MTETTFKLKPDGAFEFGSQDMIDTADALRKHAAAAFDTIWAKVVDRLVGTGAAAEEVRSTGALVVDDCTVVLRLDPLTSLIEFFVDIGKPNPHALEAVLRTGMEMNLCRTHQGVVFGVHPESGRLVATTALPALAIADEEACLTVLRSLTRLVGDLRAARTFDLEP